MLANIQNNTTMLVVCVGMKFSYHNLSKTCSIEVLPWVKYCRSSQLYSHPFPLQEPHQRSKQSWSSQPAAPPNNLIFFKKISHECSQCSLCCCQSHVLFTQVVCLLISCYLYKFYPNIVFPVTVSTQKITFYNSGPRQLSYANHEQRPHFSCKECATTSGQIFGQLEVRLLSNNTDKQKTYCILHTVLRHST